MSEASQESSAQPNIAAPENALPFGTVFWAIVVLTGIGTGIAAGLLMKLLREVQHVSFRYHSGTFLEGVLGNSPANRVLVLLAAGLIGGPQFGDCIESSDRKEAWYPPFGSAPDACP